MSYVSIYRALVPPPPQQTVVDQGQDYFVLLHPGPLCVEYQTAAHDPRMLGAINLDYQTARFPAGSYLIIAAYASSQPAITGAGWNAASDRFAQTVALLDMSFPGIAYERVYEGTATLPGQSLFIDPEQGIPLGLEHKYEHAAVARDLPARLQDLANLPNDARERFKLASRWFRRGNDAANPIDKVLFYWMVLEVYPTIKGSDVVRAVVDLLAAHVYPNEPDLKVRLNIGPICGFRGDIVHEGKASIATQRELDVVKDHVARLQAIARTCLRILAQLPPGSELDRYVLGASTP